jgi:hypothetical protein
MRSSGASIYFVVYSDRLEGKCPLPSSMPSARPPHTRDERFMHRKIVSSRLTTCGVVKDGDAVHIDLDDRFHETCGLEPANRLWIPRSRVAVRGASRRGGLSGRKCCSITAKTHIANSSACRHLAVGTIQRGVASCSGPGHGPYSW